MSIASLLPVRFGLLDRTPRTRHRRPDEIGRLQFLLYGANLCIKGLHLRLDDKDREHAAVIARIDERHAEIVRGLENQIADLERRLDVRTWAEAAAAKTQEIPVISPVMPLYEAREAGLLGPAIDPGRAYSDEGA